MGDERSSTMISGGRCWILGGLRGPIEDSASGFGETGENAFFLSMSLNHACPSSPLGWPEPGLCGVGGPKGEVTWSHQP